MSSQTARKLSLQKETLRLLSAQDLSRLSGAVGGIQLTTAAGVSILNTINITLIPVEDKPGGR